MEADEASGSHCSAGLQTQTEISLNRRDRLPETPSIEEWLASTVPKGDAVGIDPFVMPLGSVRRLHARLSKAGVDLKAASSLPNLVDQVGPTERGLG